MWPNPQETADLVIITEKILNEKLHFLGNEKVMLLFLALSTLKRFTERF